FIDRYQSKKTSQNQFSNLNLTEEFKNYWYSGLGEVNTYHLIQSRYNQKRPGRATLIFVTEEFQDNLQVKANQKSAQTTNVLKLNTLKKFNTGIYSYSIMQSVFDPLTQQPHATKLSFSSQEWCGQVYMQLNNREKFEVMLHSYFQNEADQDMTISKVALEDEIWTQLRINPFEIKIGKYQMLPSLEFFRLQHNALKPDSVEVSQSEGATQITTKIQYFNFKRQLKIVQDSSFPYTIQNWQVIVNQDTTSAKLLKQLQIDYWNKNDNKFLHLRDSLNL
ncbi:MAG: septum formation inhibitor Maf, partial [Psychroflexus salarius]